MRMSEYIQKKNEVVDKQKEIENKRKELEEAERRAQEIKESLRAEKKKELHEKVHNFNVFGMGFRPWTLNDMIIILFIVAILVVGGISFMPGEDVSSDVDSNKEGFFSKLFSGFTSKSLEDSSAQNDESSDEGGVIDTTITEDGSNTGLSDTGSSDSGETSISEEDTIGNLNYEIAAYYSESTFSKLNITGTNSLWYNLIVRNKEGFVIHCKGNNHQDGTKLGVGEYYHDFTIKPLSEQEINTKINKGEDPKTIMEHRFSCYKEDGGGMKTDSSLKLIYNIIIILIIKRRMIYNEL
jgi:hypothetical protein